MDRYSKADLSLLGGRTPLQDDSARIFARAQKKSSSIKHPLLDDTAVPDSAQNVLLHPQESLMKGKADAGTSDFAEESALRPIRPGRDRRRLEHRPFTSVSEHVPEQAPEGNCDRDHDVQEGQVKRSSIQENEALDTSTLTRDLIWACLDGKVAVVEHCVLRLCSKDERALDRFLIREGKNLLHVVCGNYSHEILRLLLLHSTRPPLNGIDRDNQTPFALSLRCGSLSCAEILLNHGADPFSSLGDDEEVSRLLPSTSEKADAVNKLLLKARKARRQTDARLTTEALSFSRPLNPPANATGPDYPLMPEGLDTGRGLIMQGQSLPHPLRGHPEVQHAAQKVTDPIEETYKPSFYMHYTISEDRSQGTVQTILANMGARLEREVAFRGQRAIDDETETCGGQRVSAPANEAPFDVGQMMKQAEYLLLTHDYQTCSALCSEAIAIGRNSFADFKLIARAYDTQAQAYELVQDFSAAIASYRNSLTEHRTLEVLERLRRLEMQMHDANDHLDPDGRTTLGEACSTGDLQLVKQYYEEYPSDLHRRNSAGMTPLHIAAREGFADILKYLVSQGASITTQNMVGETPFESAVAGFHNDVVDFLLQQGANSEKASLIPIISAHRKLQKARGEYHAIELERTKHGRGG